MPECLIGLGANLGDRKATLDRAIQLLAADPRIRIMRTSRWYETAPVGGPAGQGSFLNGAAVINTSLSPGEILAAIERVETQHGRERHQRWAARTLDLDLLLYGEESINLPGLTVPHPRMALRRFVLQPAAEVATDMRHPTLGWTIGQLFEHLSSAPPYAAIAGANGDARTNLTKLLSERTGAQIIRSRAADQTTQEFRTADAQGAAVAELNAEARLLPAASVDRGSDWTISDFWLEQTVACAPLSAEQVLKLQKRFEHLNRNLVQPKLLILLTDTMRAAQGSLTDTDCQRMLEQYVSDRPPCPFLWLSASDLELAADEVAAAMQAMR